MRKIKLFPSTFLLLLLFFAQNAQSALYNVDFKGGWPSPPTYVGKGILGSVADNTWTGLSGPTVTNKALTTSRGISSALTLSSNGFDGDFFLNYTFAWGDFADYWYLGGTHTGTITINNVPVGQLYELVLYDYASSDGEIMQAAVNGGVQQATSGVKQETISGVTKGVIQWLESPDSKSNLLRFTGTVPGTGIITIALASPSIGANIQGLQLQVGASSLPAQGARTNKLIPDLAAGYNLKVMTIGTSLTDQPYGVSWPSQLYSALYPKYQGHITLSNRAISGSNSRSGKGNIETWLAADNPDVVFIEYAINDAVAAENITVTEMKSNLDFICAKILANNPNADIILQTMNNPVGAALTARPDLELYYQGFRDYAALHGYLLVDNYPLWKSLYDNNPTLWATYVPDNIHPNDDGRAAVLLPNLVATLETALTPDAAAPTTPTGLAVGAIGSASVVLNWNASVNAVGTTTYDVYKGGALAGSTTGTTYTATGLTASTQYSFTVIAKDGFGSAAATGAVTATTTTPVIDTTAPTIPAGLSAASITSTGFTLNWAASFDAVGVVGYDVYQDASPIASPTTNSYAVTGLTAQTSYSFTVTAKDAKPNVSDASSPLSVTTLATVPVAGGVIATWNLTGINTAGNVTTAPVTTKDAGLTVSNLTLAAGMGSPSGIFANSLNGGSVTSTSLAQAITNGEYVEFMITPASGRSVTITSMDVCAISQGRAATCSLLSSVGGFTAANLISSLTLGSPNQINVSSQTLAVSGINNVTTPVTFRFYFNGLVNEEWAAFGIGERHPVNTTAALIVKGSVSSAVTGLSTTNPNELTLYPNPATDKLSLDFGATVEKADISILDLQGRTLMTRSVVNTQLETLKISNLNNGIYFVKVLADGKVTNSKFVKK